MRTKVLQIAIAALVIASFPLDGALAWGGGQGGGGGGGGGGTKNGGTTIPGRPGKFTFKGRGVGITFSPEDVGLRKTWERDGPDGKPKTGTDGLPEHWGPFNYTSVDYMIEKSGSLYFITIYGYTEPGQAPVVLEPPQQFALKT